MLQGQRILAVVPARSGSKGIPHKNMQKLGDTSLIGWAGKTLAPVSCIDRRIISTDSAAYASEGERYGLEAPFLRPAELSTDSAGAVETIQHALSSVERLTHQTFDIVLVVEPTSPLRVPADIERTAQCLVSTASDSVVTVSPLPRKFHPLKMLRLAQHELSFYTHEGRAVTGRQALEQLYWRNGVCYAVTRSCLMEHGTLFGRRCTPLLIEHEVVNIDEPWEFEWATYLLGRGAFVLMSSR